MTVASRGQLLGSFTLLLFAGTIGGALYFHLRSTPDFNKRGLQIESRQHDTVNQQDIRLESARTMFEAGDLDGAELQLRPLLGVDGPIGVAARDLMVNIATTRFRAKTRDPSELRGAVSVALAAALRDPRDPETLDRYAKIALEIEAPDVAGRTLDRLATDDPKQGPEGLAEAAKWHRAAGNEAEAARLYAQAAKETQDRDRKKALCLLAIDSAGGSNDPRKALAHADACLAEFPKDKDVLERTVTFALAAGDAKKACHVGGRWVQLFGSSDPDAVAKQISRDLGCGEPAAALVWLHRLANLKPGDRSVHAQIAQVAEWTGDARLTLREYKWLLRNHLGDDDIHKRALALGRAIYDMHSVLEILLIRAQNRKLNETEVLELSTAYEDIGEPEMAAKVLRDHLPTPGGSQRLLELFDVPGLPKKRDIDLAFGNDTQHRWAHMVAGVGDAVPPDVDAGAPPPGQVLKPGADAGAPRPGAGGDAGAPRPGAAGDGGAPPGTTPGTGPGTTPGTGPGTTPGTGPGTTPGTGPGTRPGTGIGPGTPGTSTGPGAPGTGAPGTGTGTGPGTPGTSTGPGTPGTGTPGTGTGTGTGTPGTSTGPGTPGTGTGPGTPGTPAAPTTPGAKNARDLLRRFALLEEQRGASLSAVQAYKQLRDAFGLDGTDARRSGALLWRLDDPHAAFDVMLSVPAEAPGKDLPYWTLLAELAEELNERPTALQALLQMRALGDPSAPLLQRLATVESASGHRSEAASYAVDAYRTQPNARNLFFAAELLERVGRDRTVVALLRHGAAKDKEILRLDLYWRTLGTSLRRMGHVEEACSAFDQALRVDPNSSVAFESALHCALEKHDSPSLARYVDGPWRVKAEKEPELLGPMARALIRLKRHREAVVYLTRLVRAKPKEYTWQVELADELDLIGDHAHAYRVRRRALLDLVPRALIALKTPPGDTEANAVMAARAQLARHFQGADNAARWLDHMMPRTQTTIEDLTVADLALAFYLADNNPEAVSRVLYMSRRVRLGADHDTLLTIAIQQNDRMRISRLLAQPSDRLAKDTDLHIEALLLVAREKEALRAIDAALDSTVVDNQRDAVRVLTVDRAEVAQRVAPTVGAQYNYDGYGPLIVHGPRVEGFLQLGSVGLDGDFKQNTMLTNSTDFPAGNYSEYEGNVGARLHGPRSEARLSLGVNTRQGVTSPLGTLSLDREILAHGSSIDAKFRFQAVPTDTPVMRAAGVRDSAEVGAILGFTERDRFELRAIGFRERTLNQHNLSIGYLADVVLEHDIVRARPQISVLATGVFLGRRHARQAANALKRIGMPDELGPEDLLPSTAQVGTLGVHVRNGDPSTPWGSASFPRYSVGFDAGRLWPQDQWVIEARAAAGMKLIGRDILGVSGNYNIGVLGAPDDPFYGVSIHYARGL